MSNKLEIYCPFTGEACNCANQDFISESLRQTSRSSGVEIEKLIARLNYQSFLEAHTVGSRSLEMSMFDAPVICPRLPVQ